MFIWIARLIIREVMDGVIILIMVIFKVAVCEEERERWLER